MVDEIEEATFSSRLARLYAHWRGTSEVPGRVAWQDCDAVSVVVGSNDGVEPNALHAYLFGLVLEDTVVVLTLSELHILASQKKAELLQPLTNAAAACGVQLILHVKPKADDGKKQAMDLLSATQAAGNEQGVTVGTISRPRDPPPKGKLVGEYFKLQSVHCIFKPMRFVDATPGLDDLLSIKEPAEILLHKKAALLGATVMNECCIPKLEGIIDGARNTRHSKIAQHAKECIETPTKLGLRLWSDNCDVACPPKVQSGGKYNFQLYSGSDDNFLHSGAIVVALGTRYSFYCAYLSRTFLIDPTKKQLDEYRTLMFAHGAAVSVMRDGATACDMAGAAAEVFHRRGFAHLLEKLSPSMGHSMGIEFEEANSVLSAGVHGDPNRVMRAGQVYNVCLTLTDLVEPRASDPRSKVYALQVADTVLIGEQQIAVCTRKAKKTVDSVVYSLNKVYAVPPSKKRRRAPSPDLDSASCGDSNTPAMPSSPSPTTTLVEMAGQGALM